MSSSTLKPGIASSLSSVAAAHLRERHAAGGDDRTERDGGLVADTARRVLVHDLAAERREVDRLPALHHRVREGMCLGVAQPLEICGHAERGHLVVGNLVARVGEDEPGDLDIRQLSAVALLLDQLGRSKPAGCA
jgi:hypothetical protein